MLTEFQKRKISNLFHVHDLDHDGALERSDYVEYTRRFAGNRGFAPGSPKHDELLGLFLGFWELLSRRADGNTDQRVSMKEWFTTFDHMLSSRDAAEAVRPIIAAVIGMLDRNGDDVITLEEYRWMYSAGGLDPKLAADSFKRLDRDGDGRVNKGELANSLQEFFLSNDPNAPGNWFFGPIS